ncbi:MAG: DNA primase [Nitrospira sp.]|nr:DNA primase [Nitrospira sp.]
MGHGLISDSIIDRIKERVDIVDIVSHHVALTKTGQNFKGLCPFHQEKTPSFIVNPSRQIFHCFGCGAGGNVFTFLTRLTGANFPEVVRELGQKVGVEVAEAPVVSGNHAEQTRRIERLNQAAAAWFRHNLRDAKLGAAGRSYLEKRGIQSSVIDRFGIGVALPEWDGLFKALTRQGFAPADIASAGLSVAREGGSGFYDRFRGRIMFTITDLRKRVVGFGGRVLDDAMPKYLNSPDTPLFKKGHTLFALDQAREAIVRTKTAIVVEGYFDAIALHQAGLTHAVATLGTALTPEHIQALRRFADHIVLVFDPDAAGVRAALRGLDLFVNSGLDVKVVTLPAGEDPDTFVRKAGVAAFASLEAAAPSLLDYVLDHTIRQAENGSLESRIRSVDEVLRIVQKSEHPLEREERIKIVAERLGISQSRLIERYPRLQGRPSQGAGSHEQAARGIAFSAAFKRAPEERDLALLLLHGRLSPAEVRRLRPEAFTVAPCRKLVQMALARLDREGHVGLDALVSEAADDPDCGPLATELSVRDDHFDDVPAHVKACLDVLDRKYADQMLRDLIARLKAAERAGQVEEARTLNVQINEWRIRKAGAPPAGAVSLAKE